jgi:HD-GYP domain-containing protein (c-di-GMP phosphodiesterase class II)
MEPIDSTLLLQRIERLNSIGAALSAERDHQRLLEHILLGAKELTGADGGSLYILEDGRLSFRLVHTTSLNLHLGGNSPHPVAFAPIPLHKPDGSANDQMVVTRAALQNCIINIPDAYTDSEFDLSGTRAFDARTGYRSTSLLAVPMQDHEGRITGVLQLINATNSAGDIIPFSRADESLVASLASQAAVTLNRQHLIEGLQTLLQALTRLIANAIDDKSPHTAGHCRRVPDITMALARAVNADDGPVFAGVNFDERDLEALEMAAWLHDCGKIATPEYIIDKHSKLETIFDRIHLVDARLELLRREAELKQAQAKPVLDGENLPSLDDIDDIGNFLRRINTGGEFLPDADAARLQAIAALPIPDPVTREPKPLLSKDELDNLSVRRGTLTDEERKRINNHVEITQRMLASLPFPEHLRDVPLIAGSHHERMDGKGYPLGIPAGELPLQGRILAIADIFEALTASDRGYRQANTLSAALTILARMCKEGHIDAQLYELFLRRKVYLDYAASYLKPEQRDSVDTEAVCDIFC